jgi:hypothetical protein
MRRGPSIESYLGGRYRSLKGNMLSFPFNSSTVVLYVNRERSKAGLNQAGRRKRGRS